MWLSSIELSKRLAVTRPSVYRLAKKRGWETKLVAIHGGDVWVADGHKLAFDIIDPATGKPMRMTMIMFFDWASRYPVGAALAQSEYSQHVLLALRNSIMHWGGRPKYVYLDNGKAFKSKLFNKQWEKHDLSKELEGIFPRLGIGVAFARAYNARAKVVEQ